MYPEIITKNRDMIEIDFIFCIYKNILLLDNYIDDINVEKDFKSEANIFYIDTAIELYKKGIKSITDISIRSFLEGKSLINQYDSLGGFLTIEEYKHEVVEENVEAYWDEIIKSNILYDLHDKGFNIEKNMDKFDKMTSEQIYDYVDYQLNSTFTNISTTMEIEDIRIDDDFIKTCNDGQAMGLSYSEHMPRLNYSTLGAPRGDLYMIAATSGAGKTSILWYGYLMPFVRKGYKVALISNEQKIKEFKSLLLVEVLTSELNYFGITRKKIKIGNFDEEQMEMIKKAQKIADEKYFKNIKFVKMFNYSISSVKKIIKRLSKTGYVAFGYDTLKYDSASKKATTWEGLLEDSKSLFQLASKENIVLITTFQLALHTINKRYLDASCLSNGKQVKEVYSEMVYFREAWSDEFGGEKYDIRPYNFKKVDGHYTRERDNITMLEGKRYLIGFLDKTRNDETGICILYEHQGHFNIWKELGFCTVFHDR